MPSINFKPEFAEPVKNGTKRQTIRQIRKNPIKPGDMLTMFTGQRTKECRKLCIHKCKSVEEIEITVIKGISPMNENKECFFENDRQKDYYISIRSNGNFLTREEIIILTQEDGFTNVTDFGDFFHNRQNNFKGVLIKW